MNCHVRPRAAPARRPGPRWSRRHRPRLPGPPPPACSAGQTCRRSACRRSRPAADRAPAKTSVRRLRQRGQHGVEQVAGALAVQGRHRVRLAQPEFHSAAASASAAGRRPCWRRGPTGFPARRRSSTTVSSASVIPPSASTTNSTASARPTAVSACSEIFCGHSRASGSQPPVSTTVNRRPFHSASYATRSRVTPGTSSTTASRRPRMRLTMSTCPRWAGRRRPAHGVGPGAAVSDSAALRQLDRASSGEVMRSFSWRGHRADRLRGNPHCIDCTVHTENREGSRSVHRRPPRPPAPAPARTFRSITWSRVRSVVSITDPHPRRR